VIYSYNKSQRDALFLNFILVKDSACFGQIYCSIPTSLGDGQHKCMTNAHCCEYSIKTPDDGQ
jgi:hypothetical protein